MDTRATDEPEEEEDEHGDDEGGHRGPDLAFDVLVDVDLDHLGGEDCRLRQRGALVAEIAPEITAPAVMAGDTPSMIAIPTKPTPIVPAVVQELPMLIAMTAQMIAVAA